MYSLLQVKDTDWKAASHWVTAACAPEVKPLPSLLTVFAAEAAVAITQIGTSICKAVEKYINNTDALSLEVTYLEELFLKLIKPID